MLQQTLVMAAAQSAPMSRLVACLHGAHLRRTARLTHHGRVSRAAPPLPVHVAPTPLDRRGATAINRARTDGLHPQRAFRKRVTKPQESLIVACTQMPRHIGLGASFDRAASISRTCIARTLHADIHPMRDRLQVGRVHAPTVGAGSPSCAVAWDVAGVVDDKALGDAAMRLAVGEPVSGGVVPCPISLDGDGAAPRPTAIPSGRLVHQTPEVSDDVLGVVEGAAGGHERVTVALEPRVVLAAHAPADRALLTDPAGLNDFAGSEGASSCAVDQRVTRALPADVVLVAPASGDGGAGALGSALDDGTGSVGHGRTPLCQGPGLGRRRVERRRPSHLFQRPLHAGQFRPAVVI